MAVWQDNPFRRLLYVISGEFTEEEIKELKFLTKDEITEREREEAQNSVLPIFESLIKRGLISENDLRYLDHQLDVMKRQDLCERINTYYGAHAQASGIAAKEPFKYIAPSGTGCETAEKPPHHTLIPTSVLNLELPSPTPPSSLKGEPSSIGSSYSGIEYKNRLQQYTDKNNYERPKYTSSLDPINQEKGWTCELIVNNKTFSSDGAFEKKISAEQSAAQKALTFFLQKDIPQATQLSTDEVEADGSEAKPEDYKGLLQTFTVTQSLGKPAYDQQRHEAGWVSTVQVDGRTFTSKRFHSKKVQADKDAAYEALQVLQQQYKSCESPDLLAKSDDDSVQRTHQDSVEVDGESNSAMTGHNQDSSPRIGNELENLVDRLGKLPVQYDRVEAPEQKFRVHISFDVRYFRQVPSDKLLTSKKEAKEYLAKLALSELVQLGKCQRSFLEVSKFQESLHAFCGKNKEIRSYYAYEIDSTKKFTGIIFCSALDTYSTLVWLGPESDSEIDAKQLAVKECIHVLRDNFPIDNLPDRFTDETKRADQGQDTIIGDTVTSAQETLVKDSSDEDWDGETDDSIQLRTSGVVSKTEGTSAQTHKHSISNSMDRSININISIEHVQPGNTSNANIKHEIRQAQKVQGRENWEDISGQGKSLWEAFPSNKPTSSLPAQPFDSAFDETDKRDDDNMFVPCISLPNPVNPAANNDFTGDKTKDDHPEVSYHALKELKELCETKDLDQPILTTEDVSSKCKAFLTMSYKFSTGIVNPNKKEAEKILAQTVLEQLFPDALPADINRCKGSLQDCCVDLDQLNVPRYITKPKQGGYCSTVSFSFKLESTLCESDCEAKDNVARLCLKKLKLFK